MGLSTLTSRVPAAIRNRLPERLRGSQDAPTGTTPDVAPDEQVGTPDTAAEPTADEAETESSTGGKLRKATTLLTFAGLGLAALGAVGRLLIDRRSGDEEDEEQEPETGPAQAIDVDAATIEAEEVTVETETVSETATETELDATVEHDTDTDVSGAGAASTEETSRLARARATTAEYPRIAPLVGMAALVGMRLVVKKLGGEPLTA